MAGVVNNVASTVGGVNSTAGGVNSTAGGVISTAGGVNSTADRSRRTADVAAERTAFPDWRFAPNIGGHPDIYEIENRALCPATLPAPPGSSA